MPVLNALYLLPKCQNILTSFCFGAENKSKKGEKKKEKIEFSSREKKNKKRCTVRLELTTLKYLKTEKCINRENNFNRSRPLRLPMLFG
mgnify:FL=1